MKYLPGHLNKYKSRTTRWDDFLELEGEENAEAAANNLLHRKKALNPKNFELEQESLDDAEQRAHLAWGGGKPKKLGVQAKKLDKELSYLERKFAQLKKDFKGKVESLLVEKRKLLNYRDKTAAPRPKKELKKIAKRKQTKKIEARFASKEKGGKQKRVLKSKTLTKEQSLKKMKKRVSRTRNPPSYH